MAVVFHRKEINCDDIWQFQFLDSVKNLVDDVYDVFTEGENNTTSELTSRN